MPGPRAFGRASMLPDALPYHHLNPFTLVQVQVHRGLHSSPAHPANPLPIVATGPPPAAPRPAVSATHERADRRRRQAALLREAGELKDAAAAAKLRKRFWKEVSVQRTPEGLHTVHLDARPVRTPHSKQPLQLPASKPHLATAIALEWDALTSAQQALKTHLIPLTSLAARAHDIALQDAADTQAGVGLGEGADASARRDIVQQLLRYLDTDTLLCWAPAADAAHDATRAALAAALAAAPGSPAALTTSGADRVRGGESLRDRQARVAAPITAFLSTHVWPGAALRPALDAASILPAPQPAATRAVAQAWMRGLGAWELAALERAALATKSLCVAARLVVEWSENLGGPAAEAAVGELPGDAPEGALPRDLAGESGPARFGVDEAADACTVEVRWQTGQWGEVEDSHDVEREDLRRQLGSAVLLVSGKGTNA